MKPNLAVTVFVSELFCWCHMWRILVGLLFLSLLGCSGAQVVVDDGGSSVESELANEQTTSTGVQRAAVFPVLLPTSGTINGTIDRCDEQDEDGRYFDRFEIEIEAGQRIRVFASSQDIDPLLRVLGPAEFRLDADDTMPGTLFPVVEFNAPSSGRYNVDVLSYSPDSFGHYLLGVVPMATPNRERVVDLPVDLHAQTVSAGAGPGFRVGASHWFHGQGGERVRLRVNSQQFDTAIVLFGPSGQTWINDDAGDSGPDMTERTVDSTIVAILPERGWYHLIIGSYGDMGMGDYRFRATVRPAVLLEPGESVPSVGFAGSQGMGRIYGLFVGITNYGGFGDLFGCADDARFLAEAFRARALQSHEDQVVLVDHQATRQAFLHHLWQLVGRAGPEDVLVVFFSGHGRQVMAAAGDTFETDGYDETLLMVDEDVLDNEVAAVLAHSRADTIIVAIDSCHSGGFGRDLELLPNVIGLYSSHEDILSDTAQSLGAGGYLSYYLRRAVLGEADVKPLDGALTAGELTDFMYLGFLNSNDQMNPAGSYEPLQILDARRGSVSWHRLLWLHPRQPDGSLSPVPDLPLRTIIPRKPEPALREGEPVCKSEPVCPG